MSSANQSSAPVAPATSDNSKDSRRLQARFAGAERAALFPSRWRIHWHKLFTGCQLHGIEEQRFAGASSQTASVPASPTNGLFIFHRLPQRFQRRENGITEAPSSFSQCLQIDGNLFDNRLTFRCPLPGTYDGGFQQRRTENAGRVSSLGRRLSASRVSNSF